MRMTFGTQLPSVEVAQRQNHFRAQRQNHFRLALGLFRAAPSDSVQPLKMILYGSQLIPFGSYDSKQLKREFSQQEMNLRVCRGARNRDETHGNNVIIAFPFISLPAACYGGKEANLFFPFFSTPVNFSG